MSVDILGRKAETSAEAWFSIGLHPQKPEGLLGWTAQDSHLDSHTAPELWLSILFHAVGYEAFSFQKISGVSACM